MEFIDSDGCLKAFSELCEELCTSDLVGVEECQYWVFERGYKAALEKLICNMAAAAQPQNKVLPEKKSLAEIMAMH
jgi:hypothetical protein